LRLVEADPHILKIVLDVLAGREVKRRELLTDVDAAELTGLIKVVEHRYVVRNEICEGLLRRYFTSRRVARLFSAFGRWDEAIAYFEQGDSEIGPAERAEYLAAVINRIYTDGDEDAAFDWLAEALVRGFGVEHLVIYRFLERENSLVPIAWRGRAGVELSPLLVSQARDRPEVWVHTTGDDLLERNEAGDNLFVLPLPSDSHRPAVGVVTLYNYVGVEQYVARREEVLELVGFVAQAGRAIVSQREKQDLLRREQQRVETLKALEGVTKAIMSVRDLGQLLGIVVERARAVLGAHLVTLYLYEGRDGRFHTPIGSGLLDEEGFYKTPLPRAEGQIAGEIIRQRRPSFYEDAANHAAGRKSIFVRQENLHSVAGFPLLYGGEPVGVLFVGYRGAHHFSGDEIQIIEAFSDQAAIAIANVHLYDRLASDNVTLASLYQVSTTLRSSLERQQVLEAVTASLQKLFDLTTCTVGLLDQAEERLEFVAHLGLDAPTARKVRDLPQSLWHRVRVEKRSFFARNLADHPELLHTLERQDLQSFVIRPLQGRDRFLGILTMGSTRRLELEDSDWDLITSLLDQAAVAIENAQLHQAVQQARQWLDDSLKVLTHQLRAEPAFVTNTLSTMLAGKLGPLSDLQQDRLAKAQRRLDQHHGLISSLKLYGRLKGERLVLQTETLDLGALVRGVVERTRDQARQAGLRLDVQIGDLPKVRGDRDMIEIVLINLLENAHKFTPSGGRVVVRAWADAGAVYLVVDDTGPGIPPEQRELIFEEYHQIAPAHAERGSGLGLFIARRLVEMHGGSISVVNKEGAGACFQVMLPL
jgi:signal transduction histidine kinase